MKRKKRVGNKEASKMGNIVSRRRKRRQQQGIDTNNYIATRPRRHPNTFLPRYHLYPRSFPPPPYSYHDRTVIIKNDVNIQKESLCMEPDVHNPHRFLLTFTLDATAPGCITLMFYAKEAVDGRLIASKKRWLKQISMPFREGLSQNFRQPFGTGIEISMSEEGVTEKGDEEVYPLVLKAEVQPLNRNENERNRFFQTTFARFEKREMGEYKIQVIKQVMWVNRKKYELLDIYGIGNASDDDDHKSGGNCVICLSEPRKIAVLPCRHMCICSDCANLLKVHTPNCPLCRHPVESFLEIKANNG